MWFKPVHSSNSWWFHHWYDINITTSDAIINLLFYKTYCRCDAPIALQARAHAIEDSGMTLLAVAQGDNSQARENGNGVIGKYGKMVILLGNMLVFFWENAGKWRCHGVFSWDFPCFKKWYEKKSWWYSGNQWYTVNCLVFFMGFNRT